MLQLSLNSQSSGWHLLLITEEPSAANIFPQGSVPTNEKEKKITAVKQDAFAGSRFGLHLN